MTALGIDLGTTYSCVGTFHHDKVEIFANDMGYRITPSCVAFTTEERLIGDAAKLEIRENPANTVYDVKRLIGREFDDPVVKSNIKKLSFRVYEKDKKPKIMVNYKNMEKSFSPEEISAMVLRKMKETANIYQRKDVSQAVVTVPANFSDSQRRATKDACEIAGLEVLRIINEPTAAAIAYGFDDENIENRNVLVYDLGGGTFDVSILNINRGCLNVKSTAGNSNLGGEDFNDKIVAHLVEEFKEKHKIDLTATPTYKKAIRKLHKLSEDAKILLSSKLKADIEIENICDGYGLKTTLSRAKFERLCKDVFHETEIVVLEALKQAHLVRDDIQEVILVGGSTRIPKIQQIVAQLFDQKKIMKHINADEAVAYGAAIQAAIISGNKSKKITDIMLIDVTSLSFGIEADGDTMTIIIPRNTPIPCTKVMHFTTHSDNQTSILFKVFEGERIMTKENNLLEEFRLSEIPSAPRNTHTIDVTFEIDKDGILTVSAKNTTTHKKETIIIKREGSLSRLEVERMISEATKFRDEDAAQLQRAEARNKLESFIYSIQLDMDKDKDRTNKDKKHTAGKCNEVLFWLKKNKMAEKKEYENLLRELEELWQT